MFKPYQVAEGLTISELMRDVENYINEGYLPTGGVAARQPDSDGRSYLIQALVRAELLQREA